MVVDGHNGFLIPVKDSRALSKAIAYLDDSEDRRVQMGVKARQLAIAKFDERIVLRQTLAVYDELLATRTDTD